MIFQDSDWSADNNQSTQAAAANVNKRHVTPPTVPKASNKSDSMNNLLSDETDVKSNSKLKTSDKQSVFHDSNDDDDDIFSAAVKSQDKAKPKAKPAAAVPQSTTAKGGGLFAGQDESSSDDDIFKTAATSANKKVACLSLSY